MNSLRASFAPYWESIQRTLFPRLEQALGPLTEKQQQLVQTLEVIRIERLIPRYFRAPGRPPKDRAAMARAFVAKAVYDLPSTRALLDRLAADGALRRLCGWERKFEVPSESVFSRAFAEFADTQLPQRVHEALIRETHHDRLVGSCIPSFCQHQITPKTSRYTRCSMSMFPNVSINGRIRSSGQLGRWWYSISPCRNNECVRRFTVFAFNQRS